MLTFYNAIMRYTINRTYIWWILLCSLAIINIIAWAGAIWLQSSKQNLSYAQAVLSGIYVMICAFRSFYPRIDLERYCLFDTTLSSIFLGRSLATIAEICFSIQCALIINDLGTLLNSIFIVYISYIIVPIIIVAQIFCWYATLTLKHFWHALEESVWLLMILLTAISFMNGFIMLDGHNHALMVIGLISCIGSAYIMLFIDIPMYFKRSNKEKKKGNKYLTIKEGFKDSINRRVQTSKWKKWKKEALWITPYFTFGVWLSIGMMLVNFNN